MAYAQVKDARKTKSKYNFTEKSMSSQQTPNQTLTQIQPGTLLLTIKQRPMGN